MSKNIIKTWIITDTHFFHSRMKEYCGRPDNFTELIIANWKAVVAPQDIIYHLGDVIWGNKQQLTDILTELPGRKFLIKGNHDFEHSDYWFYKTGFNGVFSEVTIRNCGKRYSLTHFPTRTPKDTINIHGHFHNAKVTNWKDKYKRILRPNNYLLALEYVNYKPVLLDTAIEKREVIITRMRND